MGVATGIYTCVKFIDLKAPFKKCQLLCMFIKNIRRTGRNIPKVPLDRPLGIFRQQAERVLLDYSYTEFSLIKISSHCLINDGPSSQLCTSHLTGGKLLK